MAEPPPPRTLVAVQARRGIGPREHVDLLRALDERPPARVEQTLERDLLAPLDLTLVVRLQYAAVVGREREFGGGEGVGRWRGAISRSRQSDESNKQ
jgi:hypothetical protein